MGGWISGIKRRFSGWLANDYVGRFTSGKRGEKVLGKHPLFLKYLNLYGSIPRSLLRGCLFDFWSVATSLGRRPANKEIGNALRDALISKLVELDAGRLGFQIHLKMESVRGVHHRVSAAKQRNTQLQCRLAMYSWCGREASAPCPAERPSEPASGLTALVMRDHRIVQFSVHINWGHPYGRYHLLKSTGHIGANH